MHLNTVLRIPLRVVLTLASILIIANSSLSLTSTTVVPPSAASCEAKKSLTLYTLETLGNVTISHETTIPVVMTGEFSGHFALYATMIAHGILTHFSSLNKGGGIHGKKMELICVDDKGDPAKTVAIATRLREENQIELHLGTMGTRNVMALIPLIREKKIAVFFPWGNHAELRSLTLENLILGPGMLTAQIETIINHCVDTLKYTHVALFHSDGSFDTGVKEEAKQLLLARGVTISEEASYNRFTMDILTPAKKLLKKEPKAVLCFGSSHPTAKLMGRFFELGHYGTKFFGVDSTCFVPLILEERGIPYTYASTVPHPLSSTLPAVREYRFSSHALFPDDTPNILSLSYALYTQLITMMLQTENTERGTGIVAALMRNPHHDIGGYRLSFDGHTRVARPHLITLIST